MGEMEKSEFTILVVDDDGMFRKFLNKLFTVSFKTSVLEAENPKIAFEILENNEINLIFLDMQMPMMDGLMALKIIRANTRYKDIPVIACSALSAPKLLLKLGKLGISDFIVKPPTPGIIVQKVKKIILEQYSESLINPEAHLFGEPENSNEE